MGAPLPHDLLLEHQAFLRRLARSLVQDPALADDLVQDTALAALRHPPRPSGSPRAWLATVMRNLVRTRARGESRRRARERHVARPERDERGPSVAAELEVQRRVVEAVERLDEPYRTAIVRRYLHDRSAAQIAEEQGVPIATVRTRLSRALERLRRDLDARDEPGTPSWSVVLLAGLSDTRPSVVGAAAAAGGAIVGAKLVGIVAAAGVVSLGAFWWTQRAEVAGASVEFVVREDVVATSQAETPASSEQASAELVKRRTALAKPSPPRAAAAPEPSWALELHVQGLDADVSGPARVEVRSQTGARENLVREIELAPTCRVDLDPLFVDVDPRPTRMLVRIDHPARLPAEVELRAPGEWTEPSFPGGVFLADVALVAPKAVVTGEVRFPDGPPSRPVRVDVYAWQGDEPGHVPVDRAVPDAANRFRLRVDDAARHAVVAYEDLGTAVVDSPLAAEDRPLRPASTTVELTYGEMREVPPLDMLHGLLVSGTVVGPPTRESAVYALPRSTARTQRQVLRTGPERPLVWLDGAFENPARVQLTEEGEFELSGLGPLQYDLRARLPSNPEGSDHGIWIADFDPLVTVTAPTSGVRIHLGQVRTTLRVLWNGQPVPRANVEYSLIPPPDHQEEEWSDRSPTSRGLADEQGRFSIVHPGGTGLRVHASDARYGSKAIDIASEELVHGALIDVALEGDAVEPATLVVHFDGDSAALGAFQPVQIQAYDLAGWSPSQLDEVLSSRLPWSRNTMPSEAISLFMESKAEVEATWNTWTFRHLRPGRYLVCTTRTVSSAEPMGLALGTAFVVELDQGATVHHSWRAQLGGRVRVRIEPGAQGAPRVLSGKLCTAEGEELHVSFKTPSGFQWGHAPTSGTYEVVPALPPGDYQLVWRLAKAGTRTVDLHVDAGRTTDVLVDLSRL